MTDTLRHTPPHSAKSAMADCIDTPPRGGYTLKSIPLGGGLSAGGRRTPHSATTNGGLSYL